MKNIEIEEDLYQYIASQTQFIGESATSILRRLLIDSNSGTNIKSTLKKSVVEDQISALKKDNERENITPLIDENITIESSPTLVAQSSPENASVNELFIDNQTQSNESVFNYLNKEELAMQRGAVGRFLLILSALHRVHADKFSVVYEIRGRDRLYFSDNLNELTESGSSIKPFKIPESPYWVVTNSNTTRKKMILTKVAIALGYSESEAENIRELL